MFRTSYDLRSDVLEEREYVKISSRHNLLEHRVDHDVAASPDDHFDMLTMLKMTTTLILTLMMMMLVMMMMSCK